MINIVPSLPLKLRNNNIAGELFPNHVFYIKIPFEIVIITLRIGYKLQFIRDKRTVI